MTHDQINRACAELCGWKFTPEHDVEYLTPAGKVMPATWSLECETETIIACDDDLPKFTQSLDAAQMAFKALTEEEQKACAASELGVLLELNCIFDWSLSDVANLMLANPLQWCEAILRAAGKWKE